MTNCKFATIYIRGYPQLITDRTKNINFKDVTIIGD